MKIFLLASFLASVFLQSPENPNIYRLLILTKDPGEIVLEYAWHVMPEQMPLKKGAVECFTSQLKSTGLFSDVKVDVKPRENGKEVEIDITPTWDKRWQSFVISDIEFEGFEEFDVAAIREALHKKGLHSGISLWSFSLNDISNMVSDTTTELYDSDEKMKDRMYDLNMSHPRYYLQVQDLLNVKLTLSVKKPHSCRSR
jgi:hypothetical protein